ncbi:MAG TPA: FAD-binding oxidoreductase [Bacteroidota bacterium]|nr:FAD-binding oxidoreductase [Bacteroidota bacterium]
MVEGEVWFDREKRTEYSVATCMYQVVPVGVVAPKSVDDVVHVVRIAKESGIPIIARGGATGLVGQAVGFGIILDFSKHMNRITDISPDDLSVSVEPGCIIDDLYAALRPSGMIYPIDPQSSKHCTVGGTIATNAAGSHGLRYGSTKNQIRSLDVILSNGDRCTIKPIESENSLTAENSRRFGRVKDLLAANKELIHRKKPRVEKWSSGYNIFEAFHNGTFDATRLLCGSEGTLAVVVGASLNILHRPRSVVTGVAYFDSYEKTAEAVQLAREYFPSAIELLDKSYTEVGRGLSATSDRFIDREFLTMLLLEFEGDDERQLRDNRLKLKERLVDLRLMKDWIALETSAERESIWMVRETVSEQLNRLPSSERKVSTIEDGAVPIQNLPAYMASLKTILDKYGITFTLYGHAGMGHIHCTTLADLKTAAGREKIEAATGEVFELIIGMGGVLSAEHGDGFVRTPFLEEAFGKEIYGIFKEVKAILDPEGILNPQKIVGKQDRLFLHDLKMD